MPIASGFRWAWPRNSSSGGGTPATSDRQLFILDHASWHKSSRLHWHYFEPQFLPGYSPDFNPIERLWLRLKADWFWDYIARSREALTAGFALPSNPFSPNQTKPPPSALS